MTHEELDAIASAWPEAARKGLHYYTASQTWVGENTWWSEAENKPVPATAAYWALVGLGMAWLGEKEGRLADNPLAAVHAAIMAVGKEGA